MPWRTRLTLLIATVGLLTGSSTATVRTYMQGDLFDVVVVSVATVSGWVVLYLAYAGERHWYSQHWRRNDGA